MAMYRAEVGDDVYGDDPTVNRLEELAAEMTGKEAALFVTSGTQGNLVALLTHCERGDEIVLEKTSHIYLYEVGGLAALGGLMTRTIVGEMGYIKPEDVAANVRPDNIHMPKTTLLCIENTHNTAGGTVISPAQERALRRVADEHNLKIHLDGARIFNAAVALQCDVKELAEPADSVQFCLSKGLAAPIGSLLVGSHEFIARARRVRKMLGGGMRQAGVVAAAGIVALETMVDRLAEDHDNARLMAEQLAEIPGISLDLDRVQTNIIYFNLSPEKMTAAELVEEMKQRSVLANAMGEYQVRLVTHVDVSRTDCEQAVKVIAEILR